MFYFLEYFQITEFNTALKQMENNSKHKIRDMCKFTGRPWKYFWVCINCSKSNDNCHQNIPHKRGRGTRKGDRKKLSTKSKTQ